MEKTIIVEAAKEGIANKILFAGFVRGKELAQLYQIADLCIMPSVMEPFGLVALESAIYETPVLISKQSGVGEVLTHALKTDFWDVDDIADKILAVTTYGSLVALSSSNEAIYFIYYAEISV
jgi:glycosyltransferase involved in cell wall biosynthesis